MRAQVALRKGNAERGVGGEVEFGVALAPVLDDSDVDGRGSAGTVDFRHVDAWQGLSCTKCGGGVEGKETRWWGSRGLFMQGPESPTISDEARKKLESRTAIEIRDLEKEQDLPLSFFGVDNSTSPRLMKLSSFKAVN